jgi:CheY-like chemotaxis protein
MIKKGSPPTELLVADDNAADVYLVREALKDNGVPVHVSAVSDGVEALAFIHCEPPYAERARPALVLLDLQMPRKSGYEVLAAIRADAGLDDIAVVVFTSSTLERDRIRVLAVV